MIPEVAHIYGLFDPRIPDVIWYVGKTNNARTRLQYYRKDSSTTPVYKWFRRLQAEGSEPQLRILETCPFNEWKDRERAAIALHRKKNLLLLNVFDGGNGTAIKGRKEFCECGQKRILLYPSDGTLRCPVCRKSQRKEYETKWKADRPGYMKQYLVGYYKSHREERIKDSRDRVLKQKKSGLCQAIGCPSIPVVDRTCCQFHLSRYSERTKKAWKEKKMAQFNISVGGTVIGVIDTLGQNQPSSAGHNPSPKVNSNAPMGNGSGASAGLPGVGSDIAVRDQTTQSVTADRA